MVSSGIACRVPSTLYDISVCYNPTPTSPLAVHGTMQYTVFYSTTHYCPICHLACQVGSCPRPLGSVRYRRHCMLQDYVCRDIAQYSPLDCTYAVYCLQYYAVPLRTCPDTSPAISSDLRICLRSVDLWYLRDLSGLHAEYPAHCMTSAYATILPSKPSGRI